ncbi:MAG: PIN domain-containing protein [Methanomassiliicoccaceae archaeon]|jgi:tRNA(fMet)-specific endonuclease VapC|nr:PIN domain-containing protein [Methanomassiliicoccaceae archaeon]
MTYYLDTNVMISLLNDKNLNIMRRMTSLARSNVKIPSMVMGEFITGGIKGGSERKKNNINKLLSMFEIVPFDAEAAVIYAKIRAELEKKGNTIGSNDLIIAATVLSRGGILVTNNTKEFCRVEGLQIEDWSK